MPRKAFVADLQKSVEGVSIAGISDVQNGNDDGEFTFMCVADGKELKIVCLIPDLSDYPSSHFSMIFAPDNAPARVARMLNNLSDAAYGKTVPQILELVSTRLESTDEDGDQQMLDSQEFSDFAEDDEDEDEDEYFPGDEDMMPRPTSTSHSTTAPSCGFTEATAPFRARVRRDLITAKAHGFKVGYQGGLMDGLACYVSLSVRIAKLGISEEAMQAWQLEATEYLVAVFHYPNGYKNMDDIKSYDAMTASRNFAIRVGVSTNYKPSMQEAIQAFTVLSKEDGKRREATQTNDSQQTVASPQGFRSSFISRPLDELLEQRFTMLLKYRYSGMPWQGAELFYNDQVLRPSHATHAGGTEDKYYEPEEASNTYPQLVTADHILDADTNEHSLPLIGMQFVLRHFVRCTEFCLICFSKMPDDLQAIKPYVCDNPLCLYQYMSLGFGPSIEHEILSQPKVVDLLVSFCYASARMGRLRDFPSGLSLAVPPPASNDHYSIQDAQPYRYHVGGQPQALPQKSSKQHEAGTKMRYNAAKKEILFADKASDCPVGKGNWIVIRMDADPDKALHCRVVETTYFPTIKVADTIEPTPVEAIHDPIIYHRGAGPGNQAASSSRAAPKPPVPQPAEFRPASFYIYKQNFDDLSDVQKRQAIAVLLDLLPPVEDMRKFLLRKAPSPLTAWYDRLSPAALGLLRWIIASNRACIMQVADEDEIANGCKGEDRLYGMDGWAQFRFAMGAPDKERKFIHAVRETSNRLKLKYPTLFAFHGSPLQNWHSIIREGLHFNDTLHGRAFGNGVYHAQDVNTSLSYSQYGGTSYWPNSGLQIQQAMALNEIVNAPKEYVSSTPHLVVAQLNWIQTRYLFVKTKSNLNTYQTTTSVKTSKPLEYLEQDPQRTPRGVSDSLVIPICAISGARRPKPKTTGVGQSAIVFDPKADGAQKNKRQKATGTSQYDPIEIDCGDDDTASIMTLEEDRIILEEDIVKPQQYLDSLPTPNSIKDDKGKSKVGGFMSKFMPSKSSKPLTDYEPGMLDYSTLPMLQMPAWATTSATKRLMKDFKDVIHIQNTTPPHELGWHIDDDKIENMYQWIVELHSFESSLPLAQDMKKQKITSVVLELRFGKDYPMSPPFVRVIRPRFLSFHAGGGGHVTAGGAMCMQLLTNDGWSAVSSLESVLLQVRMAISSLDPKPARLEGGGHRAYGVGEAVDAYMRACAMHGWTVPAGFREMAYGGSAENAHNSF